jgi:hypothetical protein
MNAPTDLPRGPLSAMDERLSYRVNGVAGPPRY